MGGVSQKHANNQRRRQEVVRSRGGRDRKKRKTKITTVFREKQKKVGWECNGQGFAHTRWARHRIPYATHVHILIMGGREARLIRSCTDRLASFGKAPSQPRS